MTTRRPRRTRRRSRRTGRRSTPSRSTGRWNPTSGDGRSAGESGDAPTENDDGTLTASDLTGPTAEDAGGSTYYGDRFRFSRSIEELTLDPDPSADDVTVLVDGETVTREEALAFEG